MNVDYVAHFIVVGFITFPEVNVEMCHMYGYLLTATKEHLLKWMFVIDSMASLRQVSNMKTISGNIQVGVVRTMKDIFGINHSILPQLLQLIHSFTSSRCEQRSDFKENYHCNDYFQNFNLFTH